MSQNLGEAQNEHFANISSVRGTLQQQQQQDNEDDLNQNIKMNEGINKPEAGESTSNTRTD